MVAATVDTVTLSGNHKTVEVKHRGTTGFIYFTVNGTAATDAGDNTYVVGAGQSVTVPSFLTPDAVSLISAGTSAYSVIGIG